MSIPVTCKGCSFEDVIFGNGVLSVMNHASRSLKVINENGENVTAQLSVRLPGRPKLPYNWIALFEYGLAKLANLGLSKIEYQMVLFILAETDFQNIFFCDTSLCFAVTGIDAKNQARVLNALVNHGVLFESGKIGNKRGYALNALLGWKGSAKGYPIASDLRVQCESSDWNNWTNKSTGEYMSSQAFLSCSNGKHEIE